MNIIVASLESEMTDVMKEEKMVRVVLTCSVCCETIGRESPGSEREQGLLSRANLFSVTFKELIPNTT